MPFGFYHFRSGSKFLGQVATWVYAMAVSFALVVIASAGVIPGIDLDPVVQVQTILVWVGGVILAGWVYSEDWSCE